MYAHMRNLVKLPIATMTGRSSRAHSESGVSNSEIEGFVHVAFRGFRGCSPKTFPI